MRCKSLKWNLGGGGGVIGKNWHTFYTLTVEYFNIKLFWYTIQGVNCVFGSSIIEVFQKLSEIVACTFFVALKL